VVYATDRYGNRGDQAFVVKDNKVYATDRYGNRRDQAYVVKDKTPETPKK